MTRDVQHGTESSTETEAADWAGPRWLWFGVLGGALAWGAHLLVAWASVELACSQGHTEIIGLRLSAVVWTMTIGPAVVAAAAGTVAWRALAVLRRAEQSPPAGVASRRIGRARLLAEIGVWIDALALLMIVFGGIAVLTFAPCAR